MRQNKKYKKARLVDCNLDLSKRWYVVFYVLDSETNMLVRKRDYSINKGKTIQERKALAKKLINQLNSLLEKGYTYNSKPKKEKAIFTIVQALKEVVQKKSYHFSEFTVRTYKAFIARVIDFESETNNTLDLTDFSKKWVQELCDWRKQKCNKTSYFNFITVGRALFNSMVEYQYISYNYFNDIKKHGKEVSRNLAFSSEQATEILKYLKDNHPGLWIFCLTMFYTFIRVNELRHLRPDWILWERNQIFIPAEYSKTRKSRFVSLPKNLKHIFLELKIHHLKNDMFVFSMLGPSSKIVEEKYFTNTHLNVLKKLSMNGKGHTLYSWKHTGVTTAYKNGVDIKTIQKQCGHSNIQTTDLYLRSLGLDNDTSAFDRIIINH